MKKLKFGIRSKVSLLLIVLEIAITFTIGSVIYSKFNEQLVDKVVNSWENTAANMSDNINKMVNAIYRASSYIGSSKFVVDIINTQSEDVLENIGNYNNLNKEIRNALGLFLDSDVKAYNYSFFLSDSLGFTKNLTAIDNNQIYGHIFSNNLVKNQDWYEQTVEKDGILHIFMNEGNNKTMYLSRVVKNDVQVGNDAIGVLIVSIDLAMTFPKDKTQAIVALSDSNNKIIYSNDENIKIDVNTLATFNDSLVNNFKTFTNVKIDGRKCFVGLHNTSLGNAIFIMPMKALKSEMRELQIFLFASGILTILALVLLSLFLSYKLTKPIVELSYIMRTARINDSFEAVPQKFTSDEIGELYISFNVLMDKILKMVEDIKCSYEKERETELEMLQIQINPHFLYNTLDSVAWSSLMNNDDNVADLLSLMSDILRYGINSPNELVPLREELECIKNYAIIEHTVLESSFRLKIDVSEDIQDFKVPKCILQPLVENSLLHADVANSEEQLYIEISAIKDETTLKILVIDSGKNCDAQNLNEYLQGVHKETGRKKIGVLNVHKRVTLKFGEEYGLHYNCDTQGLVTTVTLPLIT